MQGRQGEVQGKTPGWGERKHRTCPSTPAPTPAPHFAPCTVRSVAGGGCGGGCGGGWACLRMFCRSRGPWLRRRMEGAGPHSTPLHRCTGAPVHCAPLHHTERHCTALHRTAPHCTADLFKVQSTGCRTCSAAQTTYHLAHLLPTTMWPTSSPPPPGKLINLNLESSKLHFLPIFMGNGRTFIISFP